MALRITRLQMRKSLALTAILILAIAVSSGARQGQAIRSSLGLVYVPVWVDVSAGAKYIADADGEGAYTTVPLFKTLPGLTTTNFRIYENGVEQNMEYLSPSMSPGILGIVVGFSARGTVKTSGQPAEVINAVNLLRQSSTGSFVDWVPWNSDGIYDAVSRALAKLQRQADPRKALIVISDGAIPSGSKTADDAAGKSLIDAAKKVNFPVYLLFPSQPGRPGYGNPVCCFGSAYAVGRTLKQVAESTGGKVLAAELGGMNPEDGIAASSSQLVDKLSRRYVIGFISTNTAREGKWRKLKVRITPPAGTSKVHVEIGKVGYSSAETSPIAYDAPLEAPIPVPRPVSALRPVTGTLRAPFIGPDSRIGDASKLLSKASADESIRFPDAVMLLKQEWAEGDWRTIQYVTEAYTAFGGFGNTVIIRTEVAVEKPDRLHIQMEVRAGRGAGRRLVAVSNGQSAWISNPASNEYARLLLHPIGVLLAGLDEMMLRQLPDALNIGQIGVGRNSDFFKSLTDMRDPLFPEGEWRDPTVLRSETVSVDGILRDSWVVTSKVRLTPGYNTRVLWIDKKLRIPLKSGMLRDAIATPQTEGSLFAQPHFYEIQVKSLQIDKPIPISTFTFTPPLDAAETPALPR